MGRWTGLRVRARLMQGWFGLGEEQTEKPWVTGSEKVLPLLKAQTQEAGRPGKPRHSSISSSSYTRKAELRTWEEKEERREEQTRFSVAPSCTEPGSQLSRGCTDCQRQDLRGVAALSDTDMTSLVDKPEAQGHQRLSLLPGPESVQPLSHC